MSSIPDNVRQAFTKVVPTSVVNDITCCVFYDRHPRDPKLIDVAICTKFGDLKEYFQRDLVSSLHLDISKPNDITILRNAEADPFYLVLGGDQLLIISKGDNLEVHRRFKNVNRYEIEDTMCSGRALLKVYLNDDAVPLVFDDNFEPVEEICDVDCVDDTAPILTELMRKLTEATYSVKNNEKVYEKLVNLRQLALFSKYQKINLNADEIVYKIGLREIASALKINTLTPWKKICNKKIVIIFDVTNEDEEMLEDLQVLLHGTTKPVVTYTTKLFEKTSTPPLYREKKTHSLKPNKTIIVSVIINLNELKCNVLSKIIFEAVLMFKKKDKEFMLPLESISISSLDSLGQDFDVLHNRAIDDPNIILAILATTDKTDLHLRHIKSEHENDIIMQDIFSNYLHMEQVPNMDNVFIHRESPYHTLHGVMVVQDCESLGSNCNISVYTRNPSQVLALMHFINDIVPAKIIITTPEYKIKAKTDDLCYNEDVPATDSSLNYTEYAASILNRTSNLLKYLDAMIVKMNSNKNPTVQKKIGKEIHLFADGIANYVDFRNKMLKEAEKGVKDLMKSETFSEEYEPMIID